MSNPDYTVLIGDDDLQISRRFADFLQERGFTVKLTQNIEEIKKTIIEWNPRFVMYDLMMPECNAIQLMNFINSNDELRKRKMKVLVTSRHNNVTNVKECLRAGASDYIIKPFKFEDVFARLIFHAQKKRKVVAVDKEDKTRLEGGDLYLHLFAFVLKEANSLKPFSEVLFNMTKMLAMTLKAVRCSVIECHENRLDGWVRASSDDVKINAFPLDLNRYPEVVHVMNTEEPVVIENLDKDPSLAEIKKNFQKISFNSIVVCPVYKRGQFYGVLSTRMATSDNFSDNEIRFAQLMSNIVSLVISSQFPRPLELQEPA